MKTISYFKKAILFITLSFLLSCSKPPDFYLIDGQAKRLSDYHGKWLIVSFWAEWCSPCLEEIPELNHLYAEREMHNLAIIGISYDPLKNEELSELIEKWNIQYPIMASSPMPVLPFKLPKKLPGNYIISPDGDILAKLSGTQNKDMLVNYLKMLQKDIK